MKDIKFYRSIIDYELSNMSSDDMLILDDEKLEITTQFKNINEFDFLNNDKCIPNGISIIFKILDDDTYKVYTDEVCNRITMSEINNNINVLDDTGVQIRYISDNFGIIEETEYPTNGTDTQSYELAIVSSKDDEIVDNILKLSHCILALDVLQKYKGL